jgi:hypothetical protein
LIEYLKQCPSDNGIGDISSPMGIYYQAAKCGNDLSIIKETLTDEFLGTRSLKCSAGQYLSGSLCINVGRGYYSGANDNSRYSCETGEYSDITNGSSCKTCTNKPSYATSVSYGPSAGLTSDSCPIFSVNSCQSGYTSSGKNCVKTIFSKEEEFVVEYLYKGLLEREADDPGLKNWSDILKNGIYNCNEIPVNFLKPANFLLGGEEGYVSNNEFINRLYTGLLKRNPDLGGKSFWLNELETGKSRENVISRFSDSDEYRNICTNEGL